MISYIEYKKSSSSYNNDVGTNNTKYKNSNKDRKYR